MHAPPVFPSVDAEIRALLGHGLIVYPAYNSERKRVARLDALLAQDVGGCRARINAPSEELWLERALAHLCMEALAVLMHHGADPSLPQRLGHRHLFDQVATLPTLPAVRAYFYALLNVGPDRAPVDRAEGRDVNAWLDPVAAPMPALTLAVSSRQPFVVRWLLRGRHADVNAIDLIHGQQHNAMFWALHGLDEDRRAGRAFPPAALGILRLLRAHGADMGQWWDRFPEVCHRLRRQSGG